MPFQQLIKVLCLTGLTAASPQALAQVSYESAMKQLAGSINSSLVGTGNKTVLVCSFRRMEGKGCNLDETVTGDFEVAFAGLGHTYKVLNRAVLDEYEREHKLELEGQMDEELKMKEAAKLFKADIMIFGSYRFSGNILSLRVHADDIQTSEQLAIVSSTAIPSKMLKKFCEEAGSSKSDVGGLGASGTPGTRSGSGQTPTLSGGSGSNSQPEKPCGNTGSHCFKNNADLVLSITLKDGQKLSVRSKGEACFYDLPAGSYTYDYHEHAGSIWGSGGSSSFRVVACKETTETYP